MLLTGMIDAELASGNTESACKIAEKSSSMVDVFDMWNTTDILLSYQIFGTKAKCRCNASFTGTNA